MLRLKLEKKKSKGACNNVLHTTKKYPDDGVEKCENKHEMYRDL